MRLLLLLVLPLLVGCSTAHHARPLGKGNQAIHVSGGGPIAGIGDPDTFAPFLTATYKVGVTDRADVFVGWHILETFINNGNLYFDIGASYYLLDQKGPLPGLSAAFTVSPLITKDAGWASFDLSVTASWAIGRRERHLVYVGMHNFLLPTRVEFVETAQYIWTPYIGGQLRLGKKREIGLGLEIQWHRPYHDTSDAVVSAIAPGNLGAMAFMGGFSVFIGKDMKPAMPLEDVTAPPAAESADEPAPGGAETAPPPADASPSPEGEGLRAAEGGADEPAPGAAPAAGEAGEDTRGEAEPPTDEAAPPPGEAAEAPTDEAAEEPAGEAAEDPTEEPAGEAAEDPTDENAPPAAEAAEEPAGEAAEEPAPPAEEPAAEPPEPAPPAEEPAAEPAPADDAPDARGPEETP